MRIVNLAEFLRQPPDTVHAKFNPYVVGPLAIKGHSIRETNDFFAVPDLASATEGTEFVGDMDMAMRGISVTMDFETPTRDGCFDYDQLFIVFEAQDVRALIDRLERCLPGPSQTANTPA